MHKKLEQTFRGKMAVISNKSQKAGQVTWQSGTFMGKPE